MTNGMKIRAKNERTRRLLDAACRGDIDFLATHDVEDLRTAVCSSGCTILHWAAGSNQINVLQYLLLPQKQKINNTDNDDEKFLTRIFDNVDLPVTAKKSWMRTPLHYSCRNGHLEATKWLIEVAHANVYARAKHGVTPFQLSVWQNHLPICRYLSENCGVNPSREYNDFECGVVHWLGISPTERANYNSNEENSYDDGRDLLPLAEWLASQDGIDFTIKQRQGHSVLHKASWGGHMCLVQYLHEQHGIMDDTPDDAAGNYAADLADMGNTHRHDRIAQYLRRECSVHRLKSCEILGVSPSAKPDELRKAYLSKAKEVHPDRIGDDLERNKFQELQQAYIHLTETKGYGNQRNPAHSLNLMLKVAEDNDSVIGTSKGDADTTPLASDDGASCFKARLLAVLLEYGDKGIDLSIIKKKWRQIWGPDEPFPSQYQEFRSKSNTSSSTSKKIRQNKKIPLSELLLEKAGDVVRIHGTTVYPKNCFRAQVVAAIQSDADSVSQQGTKADC